MVFGLIGVKVKCKKKKKYVKLKDIENIQLLHLRMQIISVYV